MQCRMLPSKETGKHAPAISLRQLLLRFHMYLYVLLWNILNAWVPLRQRHFVSFR